MKGTTEKTKIQERGFISNSLGPLGSLFFTICENVLMSLAKSVLMPLGLAAAKSATDAAIQRKFFGSRMTRLIIVDEKIDDTMKRVKSLEESGLLIKSVSETTENETKEQKAGFLSLLLDILGASLLGNMSAGKRAIQDGQEMIRTGQDF